MKYKSKKACKLGHTIRYVYRNLCVQCCKLRMQKATITLKGRTKAREKYALNPSKKLKRSKKWRLKNPSKVKLGKRKYYLANRIKAIARSAEQKIQQKSATPKWLSIEQRAEILGFYLEAERRTRNTGTPYHVDHWAPLQGVLICGLHVPWNLQILSAKENISKGNRFYETLPFRQKEKRFSKRNEFGKKTNKSSEIRKRNFNKNAISLVQRSSG